MLFSKEIPPRCAYCQRASQWEREQVLCVKRGVMREEDSCSKFRYDPLKRTPSKLRTLPVTLLPQDVFIL